MGEFAYISNRKLAGIAETVRSEGRPSKKLVSALSQLEEIELKATGVRVKMGTNDDKSSDTDFVPHLAEIETWLRRNRTVYYASPDNLLLDHMAPGGWIQFARYMSYGIAHNDSGDRAPQAGVFCSKRRASSELFLLCSLDGMRDNSHDARSRSGSGTEPLWRWWKEFQEAGASSSSILVSGEFEQAIRWAHGMLGRVETFRPDAWLSGLARVLKIAPSSDQGPELVVATPLYVSFTEPLGSHAEGLAQSLERWVQQLTFRERLNLLFDKRLPSNPSSSSLIASILQSAEGERIRRLDFQVNASSDRRP